MALKLHKHRVAEGFERDIGTAAWQAFENGESVTGAALDTLVNIGIERYSGKIAAMLRRGGFEVADGEVLNVETIVKLINAKTGLEVQDLSSEGVKSAVDKWAAARLSKKIGLEVSTVLNTDTLKAELDQGIKTAIDGGGGLSLVSTGLKARAGRVSAWKASGYDRERARRVAMAVAQKKYRRGNKLVWG